jgi:NAD(P)-dependent dehydrogenase (short-subunit alcohol dehydrogenase family)
LLRPSWRAAGTVVTARDPARVEDLVAAHPTTALAATLDVDNRDQIKAAVARAEAKFGAVDVLVNNAGYGYRSAVEEADEAEVDELFATNFFGPVALIKAVLPGMRARRRGTIVNVSSIAARRTGPGSGYYAATKCALERLSAGLRPEVEPLGIKVIVVEPGAFRTDFAGRSLQQYAPLSQIMPRPLDFAVSRITRLMARSPATRRARPKSSSRPSKMPRRRTCSCSEAMPSRWWATRSTAIGPYWKLGKRPA